MNRESSDTNQRRGYSTLSGDSRGHVPFAVISVFLLVTSVVVAGYLQTRHEPAVDDDIDTVMDRTDGAVQTAVREGAKRAAKRAGQQPLTSPANTSFGQVLDSDTPFEDYLRALVYIETRAQLSAAGQRRGEVATTVSLPAITDADSFATAIDRVSLSRSDDADTNTTLRVTITGINTTAAEDGVTVATERDSVTVTIVTPVLQLHDRTERFQKALDAGVTEPGLARRFNARMYALGWARGYGQYTGLPITEVVGSRHINPSVNDAIYRTQMDIFGAADPQLNNAVRRGWLCMAMRDAQSLYEGYSPQAADTDVAGSLCEASEWLFGSQATGQLPDAPGTLDLLGDAPGMDANQTIGVNQTAYLPLRHLTMGNESHSFDAALDRIFTIETALDPSYERPEFEVELDCDHGARSSDRSNTDVAIVNSTLHPAQANGAYYVFNATVVNTVRVTKYCWESSDREDTDQKSVESRFPVTVDILVSEQEASPRAYIDSVNNDIGIENKYTRGPGPAGHIVGENTSRPTTTPPVPGDESFRNYDGIGERVTAQIFGGTSLEAFEAWLVDHATGATRPGDVTVPDNRSVTIDHSEFLDFAIMRSLAGDITTLQSELSDVSVTFERREMIHQGRQADGGPFETLLQRVRDYRRSAIDRDEPYVNVGQKALYEARYSYFVLLEEQLAELADAHDSSMQTLDDELQQADSGIEDALTFLQQGVTATPPDPVPIASGDLVSNLSYDISGSPTYFVTENVTKADIPQVQEGVTFAPMATRNENYFRMPYDSVVSGLIGSVAAAVGWGTPEAELSFRTAGDALRAGNLALAASEQTNDSYADTETLSSLTTDVETATDAAIDKFETRAVRAIVFGLYPDSVSIYCSPDTTGSCHPDELDIPDDCGANGTCRIQANSTAETALADVESAVGSALDSYETTASTAIAIGDGDATGAIIQHVTEALDDKDRRPSYADALTAEQWADVVNSSVRPAVTTAASDVDVELEGPKTVKALDTTTRAAIGNVTADVLSERLDSFPEEQFDINETTYGQWLDGKDTPLRVPAGLPLTPVPGYWFATMNVWGIEATGQYARFTVSANMGRPDTATATSYVREDEPVEISVADGTVHLGTVEPIQFSTRSILVVVVPPGGVGVGDRDGTDPACSQSWPVVGPVDEPIGTCTPFHTTGGGRR